MDDRALYPAWPYIIWRTLYNRYEILSRGNIDRKTGEATSETGEIHQFGDPGPNESNRSIGEHEDYRDSHMLLIGPHLCKSFQNTFDRQKPPPTPEEKREHQRARNRQRESRKGGDAWTYTSDRQKPRSIKKPSRDEIPEPL
jgi:hypothetical protein